MRTHDLCTPVMMISTSRASMIVPTPTVSAILGTYSGMHESQRARIREFTSRHVHISISRTGAAYGKLGMHINDRIRRP